MVWPRKIEECSDYRNDGYREPVERIRCDESQGRCTDGLLHLAMLDSGGQIQMYERSVVTCKKCLEQSKCRRVPLIPRFVPLLMCALIFSGRQPRCRVECKARLPGNEQVAKRGQWDLIDGLTCTARDTTIPLPPQPNRRRFVVSLQAVLFLAYDIQEACRDHGPENRRTDPTS